MAYDERVLKKGPWSISKANLLGLCLAQYSKRYDQKLPEGRKSSVSLIGTVAHAVQEAARKGVLDQDALMVEARRVMSESNLTHAESTQVAAKLPAIADYVRRIDAFKKEHGVTQELIEFKLAIDAEGNGVPFFDNQRALLRGVIDDALLTADGTMLIIDHKSGRKKPITEHSTQFYAYMLMVVGNFTQVRAVQCAINYFGEPRLDWFPRFDGSSGAWTREEVQRQIGPWLEQYLNRISKRLVQLEVDPKPETGWQCEYCGYVDSCEAGTAHVAERKAKRKG